MRKVAAAFVTAWLATLAAGNALAAAQPPVNVSPPTVTGVADLGQTLQGNTGTWTGSKPIKYSYEWVRCDAAGSNCAAVTGATSSKYALASSDGGTSLRVVVTARNKAGQASARSAATAILVTASAPEKTTPPSTGEYFPTVPLGSAVPRSDSDCASRVTRNAWEPRPENFGANQSVPSAPAGWNNDPGWTYWRAFVAKRDKVTGNFTGTTDELIQWAACKWGLDEDVVRAVAVQESSWRQGFQGDYENGRYHSFGIAQVRHDDGAGKLVKGGHPASAEHTALNLDYLGAELRACFEGGFYDGGWWLYGGVQVKGDLWGCVGYWYAGNWYTTGARDYIAKVQGHYATKPWVAWGYPGK